MCRESHRDLLKTAHTVVAMRDVLSTLGVQYTNLLSCSPDTIQLQGKNAQQYCEHVSSLATIEVVLTYSV
jgi:hypothetical protein